MDKPTMGWRDHHAQHLDGFRQDLGASTAAGFTRGVSLPYQRLEGFAESEMRYRQGRMLAEATRPVPEPGLNALP